MYTRASSIRSNYTTTSAKPKCMIPQRIGSGNDSLQHYNAIHLSDTPAVKNNNVENGNHSWSMKPSWPFNQSSVVANSTVVEWQDKKCVCFSKIYCNGNEHPSCTTTMAKANSIQLSAPNRNALLEPLAHTMNTSLLYSHDKTKNCCCCQGRKSNRKDNLFDSDLCCVSKETAVWESVKLRKTECGGNKSSHDKHDDDDIADDDTDFQNEIIRINNIYNANATTTANADSASGDNFHMHAFNNTFISSKKYKYDINL